ncbi:MAG: hypothetical protein WC459_02985 [Patescibacteria group bacterium]
MKYLKYIFLTLAVILAGAFITRLFSGEDDWICKNGEWVKHGNPSAPAPDKYCGKIYSDGENISWTDAQRLISFCQVKKIGQTHALNVTVWLKNGARLETKEPKIDDVIDLATSAGAKCGKIQMMTE